jgi:hypothetical protein
LDATALGRGGSRSQLNSMERENSTGQARGILDCCASLECSHTLSILTQNGSRPNLAACASASSHTLPIHIRNGAAIRIESLGCG